ncbi:MAG: tetratricopeptide repeat protein [Deltaproteobacteria bacterium]|nr:tetratricopeptide repeat protein [Deltaproteobacteria bacterium]
MADWQEHYELGKKTFRENNYAEALVHLEKVVKEKATFADIHNMLGIIYYNANRNDEAIRAFSQAIRLNPRYTEASLNLAVVYNELGQFDKAQEVYALAKTSVAEPDKSAKDKDAYLDPYVKGKLANMHAELGNIYKDVGRYDEAVYEYGMALKLRPDFVDIKVALGTVYRDTKEIGKAIKCFKDAIDIRKEYWPAYVQLGLTHYTSGDEGSAKEEWLKVLSKNPGHKLANMYLAMLDKKKK